jgi:hypothetical protein
VLWSNVGLIVYTADPEDPFTPLSVSALHGLYTDLTGPYPRGLLRPFPRSAPDVAMQAPMTRSSSRGHRLAWQAGHRAACSRTVLGCGCWAHPDRARGRLGTDPELGQPDRGTLASKEMYM